MRISRILLLVTLLTNFWMAQAARRVYDAEAFGLRPGTGANLSPLMRKAIETLRSEAGEKDEVVLRFRPGRYDFHPEGAAERTYYISNHDQTNPKCVGLALEDLHDFTLEGNGAAFVFHGRMLPVALLRSSRCVLRDLSIDFENPHIAQVTVVENDAERGITFEPAPWVKHRIAPDGGFETYGEGWTARPQSGIAFDGKTHHIVYNTSDLSLSLAGITPAGENRFLAPGWKDARLQPGTVVALRTWGRPAPGIFLSHDVGTTLVNVKVHYCEGMGLLAQLCEDITLDGFGVCRKSDDDPRLFTSQADATHFSGCKGKITSVNGLYEGMMDDAINVHGTYLKVVRRIDDCTLEARYMHEQTWGFDWGFVGDRVQVIRSRTMEAVGGEVRIVSIEPADKSTVDGARVFRIRLSQPMDSAVTEQEGFGLENLTWTPEVRFAGNTVRNNRARGALFSTPRRTVVENNLFDHTSGCAILLCGDCNGWYETGACREVIIRKNRFINALTSLFQFTNAVISIFPEIPDLEAQRTPFHGGMKRAIRIVDNEFDTFDAPILYAKSVDGLLFRGNRITTNTDFKPFHWNRNRFLLEQVRNVEIEGALWDRGDLLHKVEIREYGCIR